MSLARPTLGAVFEWLGYLDFLNSREKAILLWTIALLAFAAVKADRFGPSLMAAARALFAPKLMLLFGSAALYCAILVLAASEAALWHSTAAKETAYWFFGGGIVLVGKAVVVATSDPTFLKKLLRQALRLTIVVEFLVNLYVFPLAAELLLVPFVLLFVMLEVVAASESAYAQARSFINGVLVAIGFGLLAYVAFSALSDLGGFLTRDNAEKFLVAPALTVAFIPFLYCVGWLSRREQANLRKRLRAASDAPA
jgi:hypothetical protein